MKTKLTTMNSQKILAFAFLAIAVLSLIFAIVCFTMDAYGPFGATESNKSYGGDAYTGMQNASAQAATNAYYINRSVHSLIACVKVASGFGFIITSLTFGALAFVKMKEQEIIFKPAAEPAEIVAPGSEQ